MARTSPTELRACFHNFCGVLGAREATSWNDVGALNLVKKLNGYTVERIETESGAISQPFGSTVRSAGDMADTLRFASATLYYHKKENQ